MGIRQRVSANVIVILMRMARGGTVFLTLVWALRPMFVRTRVMNGGMPLNQWLSREPTRSFVMDTLLSRAARQRGLWNIDALERHLQNGGGFSRGVWGLLCLELWHRTFIDRQFVGESVRRSGLGRIAPAAARAS